MDRIALVTGADRGLGFGFCEELLDKGWTVIAGQFMPEWPELSELQLKYADKLHIIPMDVGSTESVQAAAKAVSSKFDTVDLLVSNAGISSKAFRCTIREPQSYDDMLKVYSVNSLGGMRVVEAFLPLLDKSEYKRLCFVSSEAGSIARSYRTTGYGYCMSKSALNMAISMMFNHLRPEGYTFRVYHPGWIRGYMSGKKNTAGDIEPRDGAKYALDVFFEDYDEDRLVMRDYEGNEWPW